MCTSLTSFKLWYILLNTIKENLQFKSGELFYDSLLFFSVFFVVSVDINKQWIENDKYKQYIHIIFSKANTFGPFKLLKYFLEWLAYDCYVCLWCVWRGRDCFAHAWRSHDSSPESLLSFWLGFWVVRLMFRGFCSKCIRPRSLLIGPTPCQAAPW